MTDQEINIAIAEACPKLFRKAKMSDEVIWIDPDGYDQDCSPVDDLNAMAAAEVTLNEKQQVWYLTKLLQVRYRTGADSGMMACMQDKLAFSTSRQRAEAFLRTVGKWKDAPDLVQQSTKNHKPTNRKTP